MVGLNLLYKLSEDDIYFIIELSRRGEVWNQCPKPPFDIAGEIQLASVQGYVS